MNTSDGLALRPVLYKRAMLITGVCFIRRVQYMHQGCFLAVGAWFVLSTAAVRQVEAGLGVLPGMCKKTQQRKFPGCESGW